MKHSATRTHLLAAVLACALTLTTVPFPASASQKTDKIKD